MEQNCTELMNESETQSDNRSNQLLKSITETKILFQYPDTCIEIYLSKSFFTDHPGASSIFPRSANDQKFEQRNVAVTIKKADEFRLPVRRIDDKNPCSSCILEWIIEETCCNN